MAPALHPRREAGAVLLVALRLLAGAPQPRLGLDLDGGFLGLAAAFGLDTVLAAEVLAALLVGVVMAGTPLLLADHVAETNVVHFDWFLVGEARIGLDLHLEAGL